MFSITDFITSRQNQKVKNILELQKYNERIRQELFIIEGIREIEKAVRAGYHFESLFFTPGLIETEKIPELFGKSLPTQIFQVNEDVFAKIAYRENSGGIVVLARPKKQSIELLAEKVSKNPLLLVIEGVEKPGNLGAIYRSADAAGVDGIIICNPATDIYNPNAIRSSLGCVFTVPTAVVPGKAAIEWLKSRKISLYTTFLKESIPYYTVDFRKPSAIIFGAEATGITKDWNNAGTINIIIPMYGIADSLNVSTSAAVIIFEASRQRNSN